MLYVSRGRPRTLSLIFLIVVSRVRSFRYRLSLLYSMTVTIVECVCVRCNCVWRWRTDHTVWRVLAQLGGRCGARAGTGGGVRALTAAETRETGIDCVR